jgi:hypothetical protein
VLIELTDGADDGARVWWRAHRFLENLAAHELPVRLLFRQREEPSIVRRRLAAAM